MRALSCVLALLLLPVGLACSEKRVDPFNVVWITIDAQRADHLGAYGYAKDTSPFIDSLAADGVLFENALSQESYTQASVPSYLTSTYPRQHGVLYDSPRLDVLDERFLTIAEALKTQGFGTAAFVFNPHLLWLFGFDQGFDLYDDNREGWPEEGPRYQAMETARKIHGKLEKYLESQPRRPVFLYLHYRDVHSPYAPPPPYHATFLAPGVEPVPDLVFREEDLPLEVLVSQYDGEILYTDSVLRETLELLAERGISKENTILILTSDHGEEFGDAHPGDPGGREHGRTLYAEQIRVPLILRIPGFDSAQVVRQTVELIDIVPTVLDALGIDWTAFPQFQGRSLLPLMRGESLPDRPAYSGGNHGRGAVVLGEWKYYRYSKSLKADQRASFRFSNETATDLAEELYNIREDPGETRNRIADSGEVAERMRRELEKIEARFEGNAAGSVEMDEQIRKQLEALGYL